MPNYSRTNLARAAVSMLDTYKLPDVTAAIAQAMRHQRFDMDATLMASQLASELYKSKDHLAASIVSSHALSAPTKKYMRSWLKDFSGASSVTISYEVDPSILGGLIISTPVGILNISLTHQLNQLHNLVI